MDQRTKRNLIGIGIVLAGFVLVKIVFINGKLKVTEGSSTTRNLKIKVGSYVVGLERVGERVTTVGSILSNEEVETRSEISGRIENLNFKEGARVKKGDLLLKLNDVELQAQLLRAKLRQELAGQQEQRQHQLFEKNLASKEEYDTAITNLNLANAEVKLIMAQIEKTEIRAPFDGSIGLRYVSQGSFVTPNMLITTIQDIRMVKVDFAIPEKYAGSVKLGDQVSFQIQQSPKIYQGTVYAIQPKIDPTTRTLRLRALCPNKDGALLPGSLATVDLSLEKKEVLMIPSYALIPDLKGHKVFVYKSGKADTRTVLIGNRSEDRIEILEGLQPGDTLITSAILQLRQGMNVILSDGQFEKK